MNIKHALEIAGLVAGSMGSLVIAVEKLILLVEKSIAVYEKIKKLKRAFAKHPSKSTVRDPSNTSNLYGNDCEPNTGAEAPPNKEEINKRNS